MTLILKLDLDMVKMYLHTKNEVSMLSGSKVIAWTDRNTDRQTHTQTDRHDQKHYLPAYAGGNKNSLDIEQKLWPYSKNESYLVPAYCKKINEARRKGIAINQLSSTAN